MTMLGAIDAGSNAIRVVIGELAATGSGELVRLEAERVPVRLGHNTFTVATSALRNASNRDVLLQRLHREAGINLEVIPGDEEASLVRAAVLHAMGTQATPRVILDLGGGSLEVNLRDDATWRGTSLPVGTVRLMETFGLHGPIGDAEAGMVRRYTATLMQPLAAGFRTTDETAAITGGNAEALAKIFGDAHPMTPSFTVEDLERGLPGLIATEIEERMATYDIKRDRAEVIGIAALVFATAARQLGLRRLVSAGVGVRDGLLLDLTESARGQHAKAARVTSKALLTSARSFALRVDHHSTHAEHVRVLARMLFDQLRDEHRLPEDRGVLLEVAAVLHDVGEVVNRRGHHRHSQYMIMSGRIPGLDGADREMVALMARCHRKDSDTSRSLIAASSLRKPQRAQLRKLTGLLRLADSLDATHRSRVEKILCMRMGNALVLDLVVRDGPSKVADAVLVRKSDLLAEELGLEIRITVAASAPKVV